MAALLLPSFSDLSVFITRKIARFTNSFNSIGHNVLHPIEDSVFQKQTWRCKVPRKYSILLDIISVGRTVSPYVIQPTLIFLGVKVSQHSTKSLSEQYISNISKYKTFVMMDSIFKAINIIVILAVHYYTSGIDRNHMKCEDFSPFVLELCRTSQVQQ